MGKEAKEKATAILSGTRFWNQSRPKYSGEPEAHKLAMFRIKVILYDDKNLVKYGPYSFYENYKLPPIDIDTFKDPKEWIVDLLIDQNREERIIAVEIDGGYHFGSKRQMSKDNLRNEKLHELLGIDTVRFRVEDIYGPYEWNKDKIVNKIFENPKPFKGVEDAL